MATTYTTNKAIGEPANGDTGWGTTVNTSLSQIDTAFGGSTSLNATGLSGNQTLTSTQYAPLTLNVSGILTANVTYVVPSGVGGQWMVYNGTTGAFTLAIASAAGGSSVTIPAGSLLNVSCDGSATGMRTTQSVSSVALSTSLSGLTVGGSPITSSGTLTLSGTLGTASGGTNLTSFTSGGAIYATGTATLTSGTLPVASGGTGVTTSTGTGSVVLSNSPTLTTPALGTPSALVLTNATGTPASIGLANGTGLPLSTGVTGTLAVGSGGTGVTTSTGTGSVVLSNSPTLTTPSLGAATATSITASGNMSAASGTSGTQLVNFSQFAVSSGSPGYFLLPNGIIFQWGSGLTSSGSTTVTFPISFNSACYNAQLTIAGSSSSSQYALIEGTPSKTSMNVYSSGSSSLSFYWFAIGI